MPTTMIKERILRRGKVRITVELEPEIVEVLEEQAQLNERNLSQQIRWLFNRYVAKLEDGK